MIVILRVTAGICICIRVCRFDGGSGGKTAFLVADKKQPPTCIGGCFDIECLQVFSSGGSYRHRVWGPGVFFREAWLLRCSERGRRIPYHSIRR